VVPWRYETLHPELSQVVKPSSTDIEPRPEAATASVTEGPVDALKTMLSDPLPFMVNVHAECAQAAAEPPPDKSPGMSPAKAAPADTVTTEPFAITSALEQFELDALWKQREEAPSLLRIWSVPALVPDTETGSVTVCALAGVGTARAASTNARRA